MSLHYVCTCMFVLFDNWDLLTFYVCMYICIYVYNYIYVWNHSYIQLQCVMKQVSLIVHPLQLVLYTYGYVVRRLVIIIIIIIIFYPNGHL